MSAVPITHPAATRHQFRAQVCRLVDRLIGILDDIDGDADLEEGADLEPSLSFTGCVNQHMAIHAEPSGGLEWLDLEDACEGEGEACEDEGAVTGDDEPEVHD